MNLHSLRGADQPSIHFAGQTRGGLDCIATPTLTLKKIALILFLLSLMIFILLSLFFYSIRPPFGAMFFLFLSLHQI